jgi:hypothetical protein
MKRFSLIIISIVIISLLINCSKDKGPYRTIVSGYVYDHDDNSKISGAEVFVLHLEGFNDTIKILETTSDSVGYFDTFFYAEEKHDFYWIKAEKTGYDSSSMELMTPGSAGGYRVELYK